MLMLIIGAMLLSEIRRNSLKSNLELVFNNCTEAAKSRPACRKCELDLTALSLDSFAEIDETGCVSFEHTLRLFLPKTMNSFLISIEDLQSWNKCVI